MNKNKLWSYLFGHALLFLVAHFLSPDLWNIVLVLFGAGIAWTTVHRIVNT